MKIGLLSNCEKDPEYKYLREAATFLHKENAQIFVGEGEYSALLDLDYLLLSDFSEVDIIICMGGDGTFLGAAHRNFNKKIPIIGINLGSIGFLTEIHPDQMETSLRRILAGDYTLEERIQLEVQVFSQDGISKGQGVCLNDCVVARGYFLHVLTLDLFIDGAYVERLSGDGIILSTPTGSTAYSLAAGGPIIKPELSVFLVIPICPHTLHNRSYVVSQDSIVELRLKDFSEQPILSLDGRSDIMLKPLDIIRIKKSTYTMKIAKLEHNNFYQTIRQKIHARGNFYEDDKT